jgi:uncharacterized protein YjbI with pentapeptide repeats
LLRGADLGGVDLRGVDLGGVDLAAYSAYLDCCYRAAACITFYSPT